MFLLEMENKMEACELPVFKLIGGVGNYGKGEACLVSAAVAKWRLEKTKWERRKLRRGQAIELLKELCAMTEDVVTLGQCAANGV